jgi:hypothetical protein
MQYWEHVAQHDSYYCHVKHAIVPSDRYSKSR